ncbi:hypothetical protein D7Y44_11885 [Stenotrophomonas maltophilia]|uniref:hypothetical protein n=1 Tax=Stenotrophomonas maltophilia TaxID=40324 RepID=UPI0015DDE9A2|nr:hypothetical protein [Stenotrophomonas maltophilia]MBA0281384.1 hypothetical protein [Stenotrophomonas maltophilia]MBA0347187.1 hypothetical protein [Stenotrophomonas maltophilia]MBA0358134.1 hypothetical protein [Stenotrophomonas maltophilia]MBA0520086.1 hypothetical protein [Stenotrophomonas maltophilia]
MQSITCPHCHTTSNRGVRVCVGCQAEVHYGAPREASIAIVIAAIVCGLFAGTYLQSAVGWVAGAAVLVGGIWSITQLYRDRVEFKRIYRTR